MHTISALPEKWEGENSCAQIHMSPSGQFLYVSNRGHDSVAIFSVDNTSGRLTPNGHLNTVGIPRAFCADPQDKYIIVSGQMDGELALYGNADRAGTFVEISTQYIGKQPMWVHITEPMV